MYLVSQRVRSSSGLVGTNSFLFVHGSSPIPGMSWKSPDVEIIAETDPGSLLLQRAEVPAGGNDVLSFLDIGVADSTSLEELRRFLRRVPSPTACDVMWSMSPISIRFSCEVSMDPEAEFDALKRQAELLLLIPSHHEPGRISGVALTVHAIDEEGIGVVYELETNSAQRLRLHGTLGNVARLHVPYENMEMLKQLWGESLYHEQVALILTERTAQQLSDLGGYRIIHQPMDLSGLAPPGGDAKKMANQIDGYWLRPQQAPSEAMLVGWPTGSLLASGDGSTALDLVFVESAWYPMSEAALYTYSHSQGLKQGELWRFWAKDTQEILEISLGASLSKTEVAVIYGREAAMRSRADSKTVQLQVRRKPMAR